MKSDRYARQLTSEQFRVATRAEIKSKCVCVHNAEATKALVYACSSLQIEISG